MTAETSPLRCAQSLPLRNASDEGVTTLQPKETPQVRHDGLREVILSGQHIFDHPVVSIGPQVRAVTGVQQPNDQSYPISDLPNDAFQNGSGTTLGQPLQRANRRHPYR